LKELPPVQTRSAPLPVDDIFKEREEEERNEEEETIEGEEVMNVTEEHEQSDSGSEEETKTEAELKTENVMEESKNEGPKKEEDGSKINAFFSGLRKKKDTDITEAPVEQGEQEDSKKIEHINGEEEQISAIEDSGEQEKKGGLLKRLFGGSNKKSKNEEEENEKKSSSNTSLEKENCDDKLKPVSTEDLDEQSGDVKNNDSAEKPKKHVSFFRQFSREKKEVTSSNNSLDRSPEKRVESLKDLDEEEDDDSYDDDLTESEDENTIATPVKLNIQNKTKYLAPSPTKLPTSPTESAVNKKTKNKTSKSCTII